MRDRRRHGVRAETKRRKRPALFLCLVVAGNMAIPVAKGQAVRIVDPLAVRAEGDAAQAVVSMAVPAAVAGKDCDVVILGGVWAEAQPH